MPPNRLTTEYFLSFFVQIGHCNPCCQDSVIGVLGGQGRSRFSSQRVQFHCRDTTVQPLNHFHGDLGLERKIMQISYLLLKKILVSQPFRV